MLTRNQTIRIRLTKDNWRVSMQEVIWQIFQKVTNCSSLLYVSVHISNFVKAFFTGNVACHNFLEPSLHSTPVLSWHCASLAFHIQLDWVVEKPLNANPGLLKKLTEVLIFWFKNYKRFLIFV